MIYWDLFIGFLRVGCFAFGGAYGAIPLIRDVVLSYGWLSDDTITYMIAVSESTPGPIMVNMATYVGSSQAGLPGAAIATIGVVLPAFIIIVLIVSLMNNLMKNAYVQAVIRGLKPCVIGIILATGLYMILQNCIHTDSSFSSLFLTGVLSFIMFGTKPILKKKISPITLIAISAFLGIIVYGF